MPFKIGIKTGKKKFSKPDALNFFFILSDFARAKTDPFSRYL
jgi:hypothetical protein